MLVSRPAPIRSVVAVAAAGVAALTMAVAMPVTLAGAAAGVGVGAGGHGAGVTAARTPSKVVLTDVDQGTTTTVTRGEKVVVVLSSPDVRWSEATVVDDGSTPPVLTPVKGKVKADGTSRTVFRVTGYGSATLQATGQPPCPTHIVCPTYVTTWQASVVAPVVDPPSA